MRKLALAILVALTITIAFVQAQDTAINSPARARAAEEHAKWIDSVIRSIATIQPGMMRTDVLKIFAEEGGLSNRRQRRYVCKDCPHIKMDVEFSPVDDSRAEQDPMAENPADKVVKISHPFLEYSIMD